MSGRLLRGFESLTYRQGRLCRLGLPLFRTQQDRNDWGSIPQPSAKHNYIMKITDQDPARHSSLPYPMEVSAPKFDLVPVVEQKDIMLNAATMLAQQEYDRIMQLVEVLKQQAEDIKRRLDLTKQVHAAQYDMKLYPGQSYWLYFDTKKQLTKLTANGPNDWSSSAPEHYQYIAQIQWLGDCTWREVA